LNLRTNNEFNNNNNNNNNDTIFSKIDELDKIIHTTPPSHTNAPPPSTSIISTKTKLESLRDDSSKF